MTMASDMGEDGWRVQGIVAISMVADDEGIDRVNSTVDALKNQVDIDRRLVGIVVYSIRSGGCIVALVGPGEVANQTVFVTRLFWAHGAVVLFSNLLNQMFLAAAIRKSFLDVKGAAIAVRGHSTLSVPADDEQQH